MVSLSPWLWDTITHTHKSGRFSADVESISVHNGDKLTLVEKQPKNIRDCFHGQSGLPLVDTPTIELVTSDRGSSIWCS